MVNIEMPLENSPAAAFNNRELYIDLLGYSVYTGNLSQLHLGKRKLINTINQYSYCISEKKTTFKTALLESDILLPDGIGIVWAVKLLTGKKIKKIAGADLHKFFLEELNKTGGKCFYLGASDNTLSLIKSKLAIEYPNIRVDSYSPPFKPAFSQDDNEKMISAVNSSNADVLFIGMTAPKQEEWANKHAHLLDVKSICSIGAVFDFYADTVKRPSTIWINLGLEWFVRLLKEPKRMSRRYLYYGPVFIVTLMKKYFSQKALASKA